MNPKSHMTMIGNGEMQTAVHAEIEKLSIQDKVTLVRQTNDMPSYYHKSDLYLFPSNYEGLGITAIEAQACGLRVLASDKVPSSIQCGLVNFNSLEQTAKDWAKEIKDMLDEKKSLDCNELKKYSIENTINQIERIYEN